MKIMVTGATGFIGKRVVASLESRGHEVWGLCHKPRFASSYTHLVPVDFAQSTCKEAWLDHLDGMDVVVNCVGIICEQGTQRFNSLQKNAPIALFSACIQSGVRKIIQVSALGADTSASNAFLTSKRDADDFLSNLPIASTIVQPSIVYGPGECSMALFKSLAALPILPLINNGNTIVQPIHVDDLANSIADEASHLDESMACERIIAVGPTQYRFAQILVMLRVWMGYPLAFAWNIPTWLSRAMGHIGSLIPGSLLNSGSVEMLYRDDISAHPFAAKTIHNARDLNEHLRLNPAQTADRLAAWRTWLTPLLRLSFAILWIGSAYVSIFAFSHELSFAWLQKIGIPTSLHSPTLYLAYALDLMLGGALLLGKNIRIILLLQIVLMMCYSGIITVYLPEFWTHPFAPILKNIPLIAATFSLLILEDRS